MSTVTIATKVVRTDQFWLALTIAFGLHAFVILGISFDIHRGLPPVHEQTLDITLVAPTPTKEKPDKPDFLAQTTQKGGAPEPTLDRPTSRPSPPVLLPSPAPAQETERVGTPEPEITREKPIITAKRATRRAATHVPKPPVKAPERPGIAQVLASTQKEIDRLTSELDERSKLTSRNMRRKAINASTQEYKYASYLDAWRKKVERIGNLNYPDEAKRKKLYGNLLLHVVVGADGSVERIRVVRSSGHQTLDDAAIRIVKLASPFAPFPPGIRKEIDVLDITRTWQFLSGNRLFTKN
jgi:protein TonB